MEEYKSASEEDKSSDEEKTSTSEDDSKPTESCEATAEMAEFVEREQIKCESTDVLEPVPTDADIPFIKTEKPESDPIAEMFAQEEAVLNAVKQEPVDTDVPFEFSTVLPVDTETSVEMNLSSTVKLEPVDAMEKDYLLDTTSQETRSITCEQLVRETTSTFEEVNQMCAENEMDDNGAEIPNVLDETNDQLIEGLDEASDQRKLIEGFDEASNHANLLENLDEAPTNEEPMEAIETAETMDGKLGSPVPFIPQIDGDIESRDSVFNEEIAPIPDPILSVTQTPTVNSSLDGNVEMTNKQPVAAPAGIKIKINLFNKASAASSTTQTILPKPLVPPESISTLPGPVEVPNLDSSSSELLIPSSDDNALTNKPRLVGRNLTVLPLMTKGVETSGLCSIM